MMHHQIWAYPFLKYTHAMNAIQNNVCLFAQVISGTVGSGGHIPYSDFAWRIQVCLQLANFMGKIMINLSGFHCFQFLRDPIC
jgi:hypothetical protein